MPRPCDHPDGYPRPDAGCKVCAKYVADARYRAYCDGDEVPARPAGRRGRPVSPSWPPPKPPAQDMLACRYVGVPTGETRYVEEGDG